jgi:adenine-specific DNA methylase
VNQAHAFAHQKTDIFEGSVNNLMRSATELKCFPSTRFVGSKAKIANWLWNCLEGLKFNTVLDAFGGTACFSYISKISGKQTFYNDIMQFNYQIGLAIIENSSTIVSREEFERCLLPKKGFAYRNLIADTFRGIYFTNKENKWLDVVIENIHAIDDIYKKALLFSALGQACLIKRPFNLFHRKNLYLRLSDVERSFNNKKCWDTPFEEHFERFIGEYNQSVFSNGQQNIALGGLDVFDLSDDYDLVYLDPPYMSGRCGVDYLSMYHFLEGIVDYYSWTERIDYSRKTKELKPNEQSRQWQRRNQMVGLLDRLIAKFSGSIIVLSHRSDGYPSQKKVCSLIRKHKNREPSLYSIPYKYALSKKTASETLFVAE